jgi:hypothetical protein
VATEAGDAGLFSALTAWRTEQEPLSNAGGPPG